MRRVTKSFSPRQLLARVHGALARVARRETAEAERMALRRAERVNQLKDEFLATLSHELRTPLNAILGWSQLLLERSVTPESLREGLETIERCAHVQKTLIDDMLDIGRIVSGTLRIDRQPLHLARVVQSAVGDVQLMADAKRVQLVLASPPAAGRVMGDPGRLQQIVSNLLSNAVKFTPEGGRVVVRLTESASAVELSVSDTGIGIAADFLPFVFDRFRQADSTPARSVAGLGLGLSIVKELVERHGGTVRAASAGSGHGAVFVVSLPALRQGAHETPRTGGGERPTPSGLSGLKVLLVDDDRDARRLVELMLSPHGVHVATATSVEEGLRALHRERPDLVLSDIGMPGRDGYDFIAAVRGLNDEALRGIPAVAFTALATSDDRARILTAGYHSHLVKPVKPARLVETLEVLTRTIGG